MKLVLEPRCLFDGSVAVTADHAADAAQQNSAIPADAGQSDSGHTADGSQDVPAATGPSQTSAAESGAREIMFVDQRVAGWEQLVQNARADVQVVVLDLHRDAVTQITEALEGTQGIEAIHIVSHGSAGEIDAGSGALTSATIAANAESVAAWADHLAAGADILIWGCDVGQGEAGQALLADLHNLTGADVAASSDATGATAKGGDWVLESRTGSIEHDTPITAAGIDGYDALLAPPAISDTQPTNQTREVTEDGVMTLSNLTISGNGTLTVTLTLSEDSHTPANGTFTLATKTGLTFTTGDGTNDTTVTFTGTAADINTALASLTYRPTANYNGDAKLAMSITSGEGSASADVLVQVIQTNDAPNLTPPAVGSANVATVNEGLGNTVVLTPANFGIDATSLTTLGLFDPDLDPALSTAKTQTTDQLTFEVTSIPDATKGRLYKDGSPLLAGSLFTLADLIVGKITYEHQGAQANNALVAGSQADSFNVTIRDGAGGSDTGTINVKINPVNQAPVVSAETTVTAYEGRNGVPVVISITDPDQVSSTWKLSFSDLNLQGATLYLENGSNGQYTAGTDTLITDGYVFTGTLAQLNAKLRVDISGAEPSSPITFKVSATDDDGGTINAGTTAGDGTTASTVVTINPVENNDYPVLVTNTGYSGTAGTWWTYLDNSMLSSSDVDTPDANVTYVVTEEMLASNGGTAQLQMNGKALVVGSTFTQADINNSAIVLMLTGGSDGSTIKTFNFSFKFKVYDGELTPFSIVKQTENSPAIEGGIRDAGDNAYVENTFNFSFTTSTTGGPGVGPDIANNAPQVTAIVGITASELSEGTGSGSVVTIGGGYSDGTTTTGATTGPRIVITDTDNTAAEITIRLETLPTGGTLLLDGVAIAQFGSFTLQDLIDGKVTYRHDGGEQFLSSNLGFKFSVSDGQANVTPAFDASGHNFTVEAKPVNDTPTVAVDKTGIVAEGGTLTFNTAGQPTITLTDVDGSGDAGPGALDNYANNAGTDDLYVTVMALPTHGKIYNNGVELHVGDSILKSAITGGKLTYTHDGTENFTDSFQIRVNDGQNIVAAGQQSIGNTITVDIQISPVNDVPVIDPSTPVAPTASGTINTGLRVVEGGSAVIGGSNAAYGGTAFSASTDGSTRAQLVSTDPDNTTTQIQYRITQNVQYGKLLLNGQVLGVNSTFTQDDLNNGRVTYVHLGDNGNGQNQVSDYFLFEVGDAGPGTYPTGQFDIEVWTQTNDTPTVTVPSTAIAIDDHAAADNPITGVSVDDVDFPSDNGQLRVTLRLTDSTGTPLNLGGYTGYTITSGVTGSGVTIDATENGNGRALVLTGTAAQINAYLAGLQFGSATDPNTVLKLEVVVDDRTYSGGVPQSDANGGNQNQNQTEGGSPTTISTTVFDPYATLVSSYGGYNVTSKAISLRISTVDEVPTVTVPGTQTVYEDIRTTITGISVTDPESTGFGTNVTVTLSVGSGKLNVGSLTGVTVSGNGTGTITLTGAANNIDTLLASGVDYTSAADNNVDNNGATAGDTTMTVKIQEGTSAIGHETGGSSGDDAVTQTFAIVVTSVNDAPVVSQSGAAIAVSDPMTAVAVGGFTIADKDVSGDTGNLTAGEQDFMQVTIRLLDENGDPLASSAYSGVVLAVTSSGSLVVDTTLNGSGSALQIRGTLAEVNAALASLKVTLGSTLGNVDHPYKVQVIADDRIRNPTTGALDASGIDANGGELNNSNGSTSAQAVPTTELDVYGGAVPSVYNLSAATRTLWPSSGNEAPSIGKTAGATVDEDVRTFVGGDFTVADTESDNFGLKVRVTLSTGGNGTLSVGGATDQNGSTISGVTVVSGDETGTLVLEGKASDIEALLNNATNGLFYKSALNDNADHNAAAAGDVTVSVTINEYQAASTFGITPQEASTSFAITVNPINDAPVISGTAQNPTAMVASGGTGTNSVSLIGSAAITDVDLNDPGVGTFGGGTLTVSFTDGYQTGDRLTLSGSPAGVASSSGGNGNALVITLTSGATAADVKAIIEALRYNSVDADPTAGGTDSTRAYRIVLNDGNNDDGAGHNAGGPASLNSNALTGTISFGFTTPTATDNTAGVTRGGTETDSGNLLTDNDGHGVDSDPESDPLTVTLVGGTTVPGTGTTVVIGTYGSLTVAADGSYTYTLDPTNPAVIALTTGGTLTETFGYTITDGSRTATAQLVVTIRTPQDTTSTGPVNVPGTTDPKTPTTPTPTEPTQPTQPTQVLYTPPSVVGGGTPSTGTSIGTAIGLGRTDGDMQAGSSDLRGFANRPLEYARTWGGERPSDWDLMLVGSVSNRYIIPNQPSAIEVPPNIFRHTNPNEPLAFEASRPDGSPLPKWLTFDARNLTFRGLPPDSARGPVDIVITAKDTQGNKAEAQFRILVGQNVGENMPVQDGTRPPQQGAGPAEQGEAAPQSGEAPQNPNGERHGRADDTGEGWDATLTDGRSAFSTQLREAGRMGVLAQARALLDAISKPAA